MTKEEEWLNYKQRLEEMQDPNIESQWEWEEIRKFRIRCIEGLLAGTTMDYKTPGKPYK